MRLLLLLHLLLKLYFFLGVSLLVEYAAEDIHYHVFIYVEFLDLLLGYFVVAFHYILVEFDVDGLLAALI
jgi:hypothetical protein